MVVSWPRLREFLVANRREILDRARNKLTAGEASSPAESELANGLPLFWAHAIEILQAKERRDSGVFAEGAAGVTMNGRELLRLGLTLGEVVQGYGGIRHGVIEVAIERRVTVSVEDLHTFNGCLDDAIAHAVTDYERQRDRTVDSPGFAHLGFLAHEMRNLLTTATFAFGASPKEGADDGEGTVPLLGRSLGQMRALIERTMAEVRLIAGLQVRELVPIAKLIEEIESVATDEASGRELRLSVDAGPIDVTVEADRQILTSVVANLVQNAIKFTRPHGHIKIRGHRSQGRVRVEVEDECGGLPPGVANMLFRPFRQYGVDRSGLGLGLAISVQGARTCGGDISIRDLPGVGCVFTVDLPSAPALS